MQVADVGSARSNEIVAKGRLLPKALLQSH